MSYYQIIDKLKVNYINEDQKVKDLYTKKYMDGINKYNEYKIKKK